MIATAHEWFAPIPSDLASVRLTLNFGLRGDDLYFRRLLVPQAAGLAFVRQLSWAVSALVLFAELEPSLARPPSRSQLAHGIEALGSKLAWWVEADDDREDLPRRVLGRRAFERDKENAAWSFSLLSRPEYYVRTTRRQSTVRPMSSDRGLAFAAGTRFAHMIPSARGGELAETFLMQPVGRGRARLHGKLLDWIRAEDPWEIQEWLYSTNAPQALGPYTPTDIEKSQLASALFDGEDTATETRSALARIFSSTRDFPGVTPLLTALRDDRREQQAREIEAASAFGGLLDSLVRLAESAQALVGAQQGPTPVRAIARESEVGEGWGQVQEAAGSYRAAMERARIGTKTADMFAKQLLEARLEDGVLASLARVPRLFNVVDRAVGPGELFRRFEEPLVGGEGNADDGVRPESDDRTFSLAAFHELVRDCRPYGVRRR